MTNVSLSGDTLAIEVLGWDKLWCFKSRLEVPLGHITGARSAADERVRGIRAPGTYLPGVIIAGTYHHRLGKTFWDVHNRNNAIAIDLHNERYSTLIVEVEDPSGTISEIQGAIRPVGV